MSNISPGQDLDLTFLNEIADGSDEFIIESIDMFLNQVPEILQIIDTGIAEKDWPVVATAAHKIKPNLGFFGMPVSQELIQQVELMAKNGAPEPGALASKFFEASGIVTANLKTLAEIKAEKEAGM
jgi:HPt (histidine-containing phosphotransfer) domain-containing protein